MLTEKEQKAFVTQRTVRRNAHLKDVQEDGGRERLTAAPVLNCVAAAAERGEFVDSYFVTDYQPLAYGIS